MTQTEVAKLKALRSLLTMKDFSAGFDSDTVMDKNGRIFKPTKFIQDETKLWRETWILPVLDELIAKYDKP